MIFTNPNAPIDARGYAARALMIRKGVEDMEDCTKKRLLLAEAERFEAVARRLAWAPNLQQVTRHHG